MADHGTFFRNELGTTDTGVCKRFYGEVVGWVTREMPMPDGNGSYVLWRQGDKDVGGMSKMSGTQFDGVPPNWMSYIAVDDVDAAAGKVASAGGKTVIEPITIPGIGRLAVIADPTGAVIALITPADG